MGLCEFLLQATGLLGQGFDLQFERLFPFAGIRDSRVGFFEDAFLVLDRLLSGRFHALGEVGDLAVFLRDDALRRRRQLFRVAHRLG